MSNAVLPTLAGLQFPVRKAPMWSTSIKTAASGKEARASFWSYPRWRYTLSYDLLRADATLELQQMVGFFNARQGSFDDWLFDDPDDNAVAAQPIGTGDGSTRAFQLIRSYGGFGEPVTDAKAGATFTVGGSATAATIAGGIVTFASAPASGAGIQWTGGFYRRCRFADDQIELEKFMAKLWQLGKLDFLSTK